MGSPYPLSYDLAWPWLHLKPSTRIHVALPRRPIAHDFAIRAHADGTARIVCFGDLMGLGGDRVPPCSRALTELFASADLIVGNCEAPVAAVARDPHARYLQRFRMPVDVLCEVLARYAMDPARTVLSIANNHIGDQGAAGARETATQLHALGITPVGLRGTSPVALCHARGLRIGVAAWTEWLNRDPFGAGEGPFRPADVIGHDWLSTRAELQLDTLLASPHWEWEFQHFPCSETVRDARALAAAGFDAIAGHHPHVVQPMAWFGETVCQFSLGNLMARTLTWPHRLLTVLELTVATGGPARGRVVGYRVHPFAQLDDGIVPLAEAPIRLRLKLENRLAMLFAPER